MCTGQFGISLAPRTTLMSKLRELAQLADTLFAQSGTTGGKAHRFRQGCSFTQDHVRRAAPPWDACESLQCVSDLAEWP
jgi:hypothetical protein